MASDIAPRVALDRAGNAYVWSRAFGPVNLAGATIDHGAVNQCILASFALDGALRWAQGFPFSSGGGCTPADVATDDAGDVYVVGGFSNTIDIAGAHLVSTNNASAGSEDVLVASFTSAGAPRWARRFGGDGTDLARRVRVDPSGHVDVIGQFYGTIDFGGGPLTALTLADAYVARLVL